MALPTISDIARVTADSEIRYTQSGKAVAQTRLAFNKPRFNEQTREWENDKTFFIDGTTWEDTAERASEQLKKGIEVYVTGDLETQQWEQDGAEAVQAVPHDPPVQGNPEGRPAAAAHPERSGRGVGCAEHALA